MAIVATGVHAIRMRELLRQYLNTEVDAIDTASNAVLVTADDFTTPTLANADIQLFRNDREGECLTVVIEPQGSMQLVGMQKHGAGTNQSRMDVEHDFQIIVSARSNTGGWGEHGAWYRADRTSLGVMAVLLKYPQQDIPAQSLSTLTFWVELTGWRRLDTEMVDDTMTVSLEATATVRTRASIA